MVSLLCRGVDRQGVEAAESFLSFNRIIILLLTTTMILHPILLEELVLQRSQSWQTLWSPRFKLLKVLNEPTLANANLIPIIHVRP